MNRRTPPLDPTPAPPPASQAMRRLFPVPLALVLVLALRGPAAGQIVPVKTVPLATGDQFLVHPSERLGMGGVSLALDDRTADPFTNPAKAMRLEGGRLLGSPVYYSVSEGNGSGRTLPVTILLGDGTWAGGVSLALQEIQGPEQRFFPWLARPVGTVVDPLPGPWPGGDDLLSERSATNTYLSGVLSRRLGDGWSLGVGVRWYDLNAVDGVEHLYALSRSLDQDATMTDYRAGLVREGPAGEVLEAILLHRRFDATHRVGYLEWVPVEPPDTATVPCYDFCGRWEPRDETNLDRTNTTGLHLGWVRPVASGPWKVGLALTANYKDHPKIPNYEIMNIPRDPGTTWAWNLGVGVARSVEAGSFGVDAIFEPIRTETWAVADETVDKPDGGTIEPGQRTVENDFAFHNVRMRMGASRRFGPTDVRLGLQVHSVSYELEQLDRVQERRREQDESWMEWTPTWGASVDLGELSLRYDGRLTTGTGRPGTAWSGGQRATADAAVGAGADFVPAPTGPLTLQDARVWTHQVAVAIALE